MIEIGAVGAVKTLYDSTKSIIEHQKRKDSKGFTPTEVIALWNHSLKTGDMTFAYERTFTETEESRDFIKRKWGSLEGLHEIYKESPEGTSIHIHEHLDPYKSDKASVVYDVAYEGGKVTRWKDTLVLHNGIWKVRPEFVLTEDLKN